MSYVLTGGDGTMTAQSKPLGRRISYNAGDSQTPSDWRTVDQDSVNPVATAPGRPATPVSHSKASKKGDPKAKLRRDEMRRKILHAKAEAEGMIVAAEGGDQTRVSNLVYKLRDTLQDHWVLRHDREDDWVDILTAVYARVAHRPDVSEPNSLTSSSRVCAQPECKPL